MIDMRLHCKLYSSTAVEQASAAFADYARIDHAREGDYWHLQISSNSADERTVAGELVNYALGLTVEERGAQ